MIAEDGASSSQREGRDYTESGTEAVHGRGLLMGPDSVGKTSPPRE